MIQNIGITADYTYFVGNVYSLPREFTKYINEHFVYKNRMYIIMGWRHTFVKLYR